MISISTNSNTYINKRQRNLHKFTSKVVLLNNYHYDHNSLSLLQPVNDCMFLLLFLFVCLFFVFCFFFLGGGGGGVNAGLFAHSDNLWWFRCFIIITSLWYLYEFLSNLNISIFRKTVCSFNYKCVYYPISAFSWIYKV